MHFMTFGSIRIVSKMQIWCLFDFDYLNCVPLITLYGVIELANIGLSNYLPRLGYQGITSTYGELLSIGNLWTDFSKLDLSFSIRTK